MKNLNLISEVIGNSYAHKFNLVGLESLSSKIAIPYRYIIE